MKKFLAISAIVVLAVLALGVAGIAYAQTQTPPQPGFPMGRGMMRGWGDRGFGPGMMGRWGEGGYGPMHEYMEDAFAEALGISHDDLEAKLDAGETMWSIAQAQGLSDEEISQLMIDARTKALEKAVADGVLTQEQADWMTQRMQQAQESGFGPGACHGSGGPGRGPAQRWNDQ
jgi:Spy/CpxP family protein refolding chaperone